MAEPFNLSIPKRYQRLWNIWSRHPKNARNKSESILKLIKEEVLENKELYGIL